jgi:cytochrome c-type protein NapB
MAVAVVGFFVGLADGVPSKAAGRSTWSVSDAEPAAASAGVIPATNYAEIAGVNAASTKDPHTIAKLLPPSGSDTTTADPAAIEYGAAALAEEDKLASAKMRAARRAYNGAPPVVPHPVQSTNDAACYACHSQGMKLEGVRASVMSHRYLANCTQCHAPPPPAALQAFATPVDSKFVGLPAPERGQRAYSGAPPVIPHTQWMRENCNACHGQQGWSGMKSTHPWRTNCTQCHAPSANLEQTFTTQTPALLPPLNITD